MPVNYGIHASEAATSISTPVVADSGLPFVVGTAPLHTAENPAEVMKPVLCTSWSEAVEKLGFSYDWKKYTLCEFMYSHFQLFQAQPVIFCNVLDPKENTKDLAGKSYAVANNAAEIPFDATDITVSIGVDGEEKAEKHETFTLDDGEWKGVKSSDLVCPGTIIAKDGKVYGNIPYAKANAQFGEGKEEGYYLPVQLGEGYSSKKYKLTRAGLGGESASLNGTSSLFDSDPQMVVSLGKDAAEAKKAIVKFFEMQSDEAVEGKEPFLTLDFSNANFLDKDAKVTFEDGTDYVLDYDADDGVLKIEILSAGAATECKSLYVSGKIIDTTEVKDTDIVAGINAIDLCMTVTGKVPDLIAAPGYSHSANVSAVMAAKAENINGLFTGKAVIDLDMDAVQDYSAAIQHKTDKNLVDPNLILCWPMVQLGDYRFHLSTQLCGLMAKTDTGNAGIPYESPSNLNLQMDACVLPDGSEVTLTFEQANILKDNAITTALNFMQMGWVAWGNYTACYPSSTDVKDYFIPISRMFDFVKTTLIRTFWSRVDRPMTRRMIDNIVDSTNIWLNGLVAAERLYGARVEVLDDENPLTDLMQGIIRVHVFIAPPPPMQECDFIVEYDPSYVSTALGVA